jgi:hypothetical protein
MLLTLLQSQGGPLPPPPPPPSGGGPGGPGSSTSVRGVSPAHEWELELLQAARLASVAKQLARSDRPQAKRLARKVADYSGTIKEAESLQREIAKLEAVQRERSARTADEVERDRELRAAVNELADILLEEEDAIQAFITLEEFETGILLSALGLKIH